MRQQARALQKQRTLRKRNSSQCLITCQQKTCTDSQRVKRIYPNVSYRNSRRIMYLLFGTISLNCLTFTTTKYRVVPRILFPGGTFLGNPQSFNITDYYQGKKIVPVGNHKKLNACFYLRCSKKSQLCVKFLLTRVLMSTSYSQVVAMYVGRHALQCNCQLDMIQTSCTNHYT